MRPFYRSPGRLTLARNYFIQSQRVAEMHDPIETAGQKTITPDHDDKFQIEWQPRGKTTGVLYINMNGVTVLRIGPMPIDQVEYVTIPKIITHKKTITTIADLREKIKGVVGRTPIVVNGNADVTIEFDDTYFVNDQPAFVLAIDTPFPDFVAGEMGEKVEGMDPRD